MFEAAALTWHLADLALDIVKAPRWARLTVAGVGVVWSVYFFHKKIGGLPRRELWVTTRPR